ncbi:hypothetical protein HDU98_002641, partial [Podochytrium sp. JEL0797]
MYPAESNRFVFQSSFWGPEYLEYVWLLVSIYAAFQIGQAIIKKFLPQVKKPDVFAFYLINLVVTSIAAYYFLETTIHVVLGSDSFFLYATNTFGATNLIAALYMSEVMLRSKTPMPLLIHHLATVAMVFWGPTMRNETQLKQLLLMLLFATLEQPCQVGMICYRIGSPRVQVVGLWIAFVGFAATRVANVVSVVWLAAIEWQYYELSFKIVYPPFVVLISWAQFMTLKIYWTLLQRVARKEQDHAIGDDQISTEVGDTFLGSDIGCEQNNQDDNEKRVSDCPESVTDIPQSPLPEDAAKLRPRNNLFEKLGGVAFYLLLLVVTGSCVLVIFLVPSSVSMVPYWLDGSHNHPYFPESGMANISYATVQGYQFPTNLPSVQDVCSKVLNRTLMKSATDPNQRSLFDVSFGQFASHDFMDTSFDKTRMPIFVGGSPEETAWPWIDNNAATSWLDLSNLYGTTPETLEFIRDASDPCKLRLDSSGEL